MDSWLDALLLGAVGGATAWRSTRVADRLARLRPLLAWLACVPLAVAVARCGPAAALTGALTFGSAAAAVMSSHAMRALLPLTVGLASAGAASVAAIGAVAVAHDARLLALAVPLVAVGAALPARLMGAPRWVANPLACTQEPWRALIHLGRFVGDLGVCALVGAGGAAAVLALSGEWRVAGASSALVLAAIGVGEAALRRADARVDRSPRVPVAAVVVDGAPPASGAADGLWPLHADEYRDVEATRARYEPHVRAAAQRGAAVVALPEVALSVGGSARGRWLEIAASWARTLNVTIVAPFFDLDVPRNTLRVIEPDGTLHTYDKQHPARGLEPAAGPHRAIGPHAGARAWSLCTVLCVDLDYADLVAPARRAGGVLFAPSNDWLDGFHERHHRTAIWAAVLSGTTVVRATGHGISSVFDGAGRLLARASSERGPVVMVVDAPIACWRGHSRAAELRGSSVRSALPAPGCPEQVAAPLGAPRRCDLATAFGQFRSIIVGCRCAAARSISSSRWLSR